MSCSPASVGNRLLAIPPGAVRACLLALQTLAALPRGHVQARTVSVRREPRLGGARFFHRFPPAYFSMIMRMRMLVKAYPRLPHCRFGRIGLRSTKSVDISVA